MKLESLVTSLELSKKMEELGVEQKSIFVWEYYDENCYALKYYPYKVSQLPHTYDENFANSLAEMLIYLIENGLVKV